MTTTLDTYETALLASLRQEVASRRPRKTRKRLGGAALGAAAAGAAAFALWPSPAWAVDGQADGDVQVTIRAFEDVDGLRAALKAQGVDAVVEHIAKPTDDVLERGDTSGSPACDAISRFRASIGGGEATYVIPAAGVKSDAVLHIAHGGDLGTHKLADFEEHESWISVWWEGGPCPTTS